MLEDALEHGAALNIALVDRLFDVVDDHALDAHLAARRMHKIAAEFGGEQFRQVLMLSDSEDFVLGEIGHVDAVLQSQIHDVLPYALE